VFGVNGSSAITGATLVTPALGTPASGVLTNCTGVPAAALPAGSVLQVVQVVVSATQTTNNNTSYYDLTGLTITITPAASTSKFLILYSVSVNIPTGTGRGASIAIARNGTRVLTPGVTYQTYSPYEFHGICAMQYLDSPATASSITYKLQAQNYDTGAILWQETGIQSTLTVMEIAG
jgi:hypothetical protein